MKKTVTILSAMLVCVAVFFYVPVYAAESYALNRKTNSKIIGDIQVSITAYQGYPYGSTSLIGGYEEDTYIYVRIRNNSYTQAHLITPVEVQPTYASAAQFVSSELYTSDLVTGDRTAAGTYTILAGGEYNRGGSILLGPSQTLYCFFTVTNRATFNTSDQTVTSPALSGVTIYDFTVGNFDGQIPSDPVDLSDIETLLDSVENNTDQIEALLNDIKNSLAFTGTVSSITSKAYGWKTFDLSSGNSFVSGFSASLKVFTLSSFVLDETVAVSLPNFTYRHDCYVVPLQFRFSFSNTTGHAVKTSARLNITDFVDKADRPTLLIYGNDLKRFDTPYFDTSASTNYISMYMPVSLNMGGYGYLPNGSFSETFTVLCIYDSVVSSTYNPNLVSVWTVEASDYDISVDPIIPIDNINRYVQMIYEAYAQVNGVGDLSDNSNDLTEGLNNAHQAEQNYFSDNSQALAASGINNPNFETADRTGINSAIAGNKNQFGMLWNAIGPWRNVYVYASLMCLVTYLLRHRPWIRSGSGDYDSILHDKYGGK